MKLGTIYLVTWIDSIGSSGWRTIDEIPLESEICTSIGWLIRETKETITLVGSKSLQTNSFNGVLTIPKIAIRKKKICS